MPAIPKKPPLFPRQTTTPTKVPWQMSSCTQHVRAVAVVSSCTYCTHMTQPVVINSPPRQPTAPFSNCQTCKAVTATGDLFRESKMDAEKLRVDLIKVLCSRRREVPLRVEPAKPVQDPLFQDNPASRSTEVMDSCPKQSIPNFKDLLVEENLYLYTEDSEQGRLPLLILSMKESSHTKRPAIVILHSSFKCKEWVRPLLEAYASRGYICIAIDSRYHGERAENSTTYKDALVSAWNKGDTMPFIYDTAWDLIKLADYLTTQREDIDPTKIGITGESLGGMHAWFAAAADTRYTVVVPIIGVQGFRWAIEHDKWHARVDSIKPVFEAARADLGKELIDKEVVEKVWDKIAPGLASQFDSPFTIPAIAPRPLLIPTGAEDPRCPLGGLEIPKANALSAYEKAGCPDKFQLVEEVGVEHQMTKSMVKAASDWFDQFLPADHCVEKDELGLQEKNNKADHCVEKDELGLQEKNNNDHCVENDGYKNGPYSEF